MAEYTGIMRQQKRMCKYYETIVGSCEGCPIHEEEIAYICVEAPCAIDIEDVDKAEKLIGTWAEKHPEPVYPTWEEWLIEIGVTKPVIIGEPWPVELPGGSMIEPAYKLVADTRKRIPAEIAEKLGIKPLEG